jgi:hypothetical protein
MQTIPTRSAPGKMYPAFLQSQPPSPLQTPPVVLLRVECHDRNSPVYNETFKDFNMVARGPNRPITRQAFDDCLSWEKVNTPFIPFTSKWERALKRRRRLIQEGQKDVVIIAIWSKGLRNVYDAYEVAKTLGFCDGGSNARKRLAPHLHEYLVFGGIPADEYRILAVFNGQREQENIALSVPRLLSGSATVPDAFMTDVPGRTANEKLENEIYQHTGIRGESGKLLYLIGLMIGAFDCPWTSFVVVQTPQE